ncbi:MAG TPA: FliA/WhiG family RNA polymerase sigma factor [Ktedonobacteraceae bacterium]|nr:FliA/WhiG family RNA polymerase sigma factor [Ktedonobacteraceae bacterium]
MSVSATIDELWADFVATRRPELREELIAAYAPLARYVVGRLGIPSTSLLEADDLLSYGMIGLINAIDRYDPARGIRFEAFATSRIRGAVIDQLRTLNWLPRSAVARVRQIEQALAQLEQHYGRPATEVEAAKALNVSLDRYRQMLLEAGAMILSLDAPLGAVAQQENEGALSLGDLIEDHSTPDPLEQAEKHEMLQLLSTTIDQLPERERLLLSLYYQEELTMKEISKIMGVSESRVCQLHMQAILRLRSAFHLRQEKARSKKVQHAHVIDK